MKHIILSLFALHSSIFTLSAAVPVPWTVDMRRAQPATFEEYQGETLDFKAALMLDGKPFEAPSNYSFFWQTNGMGRYYWSRPVSSAPSPTNVLFATWLPEYDCGARVYNCFIGSPSNNYHSAFQLRLRPSPGATPNELPLPQKVIDFAKVTVLNPPWSSGGGVDTNTVREIVEPMIGAATNGLRRVDDMAVYTNTLTRWEYVEITGEDSQHVEKLRNAISALGEKNQPLGYYFGDVYYYEAPRLEDPPEFHWTYNQTAADEDATEVRLSIDAYYESVGRLIDLYALIRRRHVQSETSNRLATENGVNEAIAANEKTGTNEQVVRGRWDEIDEMFRRVKVEESETADYAEMDIDGLPFRTTYAKKDELSAAISTNNPAFVSAVRAISPNTIRTYDNIRHCWWVLEMVNGVPTWTVED